MIRGRSEKRKVMMGDNKKTVLDNKGKVLRCDKGKAGGG